MVTPAIHVFVFLRLRSRHYTKTTLLFLSLLLIFSPRQLTFRRMVTPGKKPPHVSVLFVVHLAALKQLQMSQKPIDMNQAKQILQLHSDGVPIKEIVRRTAVSRKTVRKYLRNIKLAAHKADATTLADSELASVIYNHDSRPSVQQRFESLIKHFDDKKDSLHKTGVTRQLLWAAYISQHPDGYKYSQYCYLFTKYLKDTNPAFHWHYQPAEFIQVDFAGKKLNYLDRSTTQMIACQVFVAVLPHSGLIFCMAVRSQQGQDFAHCINKMLKYVGGVTKTILCDNLKTAVTRADKYEPVFTELCHQMSDHYHTTFSATRPHAPTDKAMVEKAVGIVYTHVYGPLYNQVPGSLEELNMHIGILLDKLNHKPYKGTSESRRDIFVSREQGLLKTLPNTPYSIKKCKQLTVQRNYTVRLPDNKHCYSVPYQYVGCKVRVYYDDKTLEVYHHYECIAFHGRSSVEPTFNRITEHMPAHHRHMLKTLGWTTEELLNKAGCVGPYTRQAADRIIHSSIYAEQNYKACHAMIGLQNKYGAARLEAACQRACGGARPTLKMIRNILQAGLDTQPLIDAQEQHIVLLSHDNIRGRESYC